jgi:hypothetical protein
MATQGRTPTNISMKWTNTDTRRMEWGVRCCSRSPNSSRSKRKEEIGGASLQEIYELKRMNSP